MNFVSLTVNINFFFNFLSSNTFTEFKTYFNIKFTVSIRRPKYLRFLRKGFESGNRRVENVK